MNLKKISISNFKSINNEIILSFTNNFVGLIGFNGTGKSNILKAINLINIENPIYLNMCYKENIDKKNLPINIKFFLSNLSLNNQIDLDKLLKTNISALVQPSNKN
jgi:predicted ATP-dependent endonuclease of OLD family